MADEHSQDEPTRISLRRRNQMVMWWVFVAIVELIALLMALGVISPDQPPTLAGRLGSLALMLFGAFIYLIMIYPRVILNADRVTVIDFFWWHQKIAWTDVSDVVDDGGIVIELKNGKRVRVACLSPTGFDRSLPGYEAGTVKFIATMREWMVRGQQGNEP